MKQSLPGIVAIRTIDALHVVYSNGEGMYSFPNKTIKVKDGFTFSLSGQGVRGTYKGSSFLIPTTQIESITFSPEAED
jgi:hypothetical protein